MTSILDRVIKVAKTQYPEHEDTVGPEASLVDDLGEDSLDRVELCMAMEEEFEINIEDDDAEQWTTIQSIADYVTQHPDMRAAA